MQGTFRIRPYATRRRGIQSKLASTLPLVFCCFLAFAASGQVPFIALDRPSAATDFPLATASSASAIYIAPGNPETVRVAAEAFAADVALVTGTKPRIVTSLASLASPLPANLILVGVLGQSPEIDRLAAAHRIDTSAVAGHWESAVTTTVANPLPAFPSVQTALVIAAADRRGAAFALFTLSRQMGVSPWTWWADVPVAHHAAVYVQAGPHLQHEPSVQYRGIFINDEDWGMRPWAAKKMDPDVDSARGGVESAKGNFGPHTYEHIFELLLRLHANSLWPAMHPGSLAFNAIAENARLADKWGIVMGSSHSEALLRNNVGEWSEKAAPAGDGPWNYQTNAPAMNAYWDKRLSENGMYENFYTVGLRGLHDSGLEATGNAQVKAKLVEDVMTAQRKLLAKDIDPDLPKIPQVIWLYKESLDLYRAGMQVPDDVTLGWTDDNYGYLRELPNAVEQKRAGGSGVYYHVSYWGAPHDYLWLSTTPPALIREEMTKAYDHNARKYWVLNVGDLKPAEIDIDYFMQLAWDEPETAALTQREWLRRWLGEQFPLNAQTRMPSTYPKNWWPLHLQLAEVFESYYQLNFIRKPEFMGFNGYNDGINRTAFNTLAWPSPTFTRGPIVQNPPGSDQVSNSDIRHGHPDQNQARAAAWFDLSDDAKAIAETLTPQYASAFFELVAYPVESAAAMNQKFLSTDLTYLDAHNHNAAALAQDTAAAQAAYDTIQTLTARYNILEDGKWDGMMSAHPRERHVFEMPRTATLADADIPLPAQWQAPAAAIAPGFVEQSSTVSINAARFTRKQDGDSNQSGQKARWTLLPDLGISGASIVYGAPGLLANAPLSNSPAPDAPWLEYDFTTISSGAATLTLHLLPTFAVDSDHRLRYAVSIDGHPTLELDASGPKGQGPDTATWSANVLRNSAIATMHLDTLAPGAHTIRLGYRDPGVVFEHLVLTFPGAPPAYPVPPETTLATR